ncbi:MAG: SCO family protein [Gammaproteobacteria bacterium]|nr:SCO family protein [Gammaproteobacteria bacterium]
MNILICGLLLQILVSFNAVTASQSIAAPGADSGQAFDYDEALAQSQGAIGNRLGNHEFVNADGIKLRLDQLQGKPLVLSMVYTSCYQICPMTTRHLSKVVQKAREALGEDSFAVAVIGFDSGVDTPAAMRYFADKQGISDKNWQLLSADKGSIEALTADLGFQYFPSSNGFDHLIQATVIDAEGKVYRQVYGQVFDTPLLVDPLIELVLGRTPPEQRLLANLVSKIKLFCTTYDPVRDGYYFDYSLFLGMLIGGSIIAFGGMVVVRGWSRG